MKSPKNPPPTLERVPTRLRLFCEDGGGIRLEAATTLESDKPPLRRFSMTAYTGGAMQLGGWRYPVVVDLAGLRISKKSRPILKDHNPGQIVGHTDQITVAEQSLEVMGVISGTGATAQEIIATSENGFPWQASIGAVAEKVVFITDGKTAAANGREFTGPMYIARKSVLGEVSFVALGADDDTYARVAAEAGQPHLEVTTMEFDAWAKQHGFDVEAMDEPNRASLQAMYEQAGQGSPSAPPAAPPVAPPRPCCHAAARGGTQAGHRRQGPGRSGSRVEAHPRHSQPVPGAIPGHRSPRGCRRLGRDKSRTGRPAGQPAPGSGHFQRPAGSAVGGHARSRLPDVRRPAERGADHR